VVFSRIYFEKRINPSQVRKDKIISKSSLLALAVWILVLLSKCATSENVAPRFDNFFIKYYGTDGDQYGVDLKSTSDGGYVLIGTSDPDKSLSDGNDNDTGDEDIVVVKTDSLGNQEWIVYINSGGASYDQGKSVVEIQGGYVIVGNVIKSGSDVVLYQLGLDGSIVAGPFFFDEGGRETCHNITILSSGYIIAGSTTATTSIDPNDPNEQDFYTIKLDQNFVEDPDWSTNKISGRQGRDTGIKVFPRSIGSDTLVIFGTTDEPDETSQLYEGNTFTSWQYIGTVNGADAFYGDLEKQSCFDIAESVGGFLMIGTQVGPPNRMYYARTNQLAPAINTIVFTQFNLEGRSIVRSIDGDNIVLGQIEVSGNKDIFLGKIDFNGGEKWSRTFGDNGQDDGSKVIENPDGSIVFVGTMNLSGQRKITLIKTNSEGELKL